MWRYAETLVNAEPDEERAAIAADIQEHAAQWGGGDRGFVVPGSRESRQHYCAQQLAG